MGFHPEYIADTTKAMKRLRCVYNVIANSGEIKIFPKKDARNFEKDVLAEVRKIYKIIGQNRA